MQKRSARWHRNARARIGWLALWILLGPALGSAVVSDHGTWRLGGAYAQAAPRGQSGASRAGTAQATAPAAHAGAMRSDILPPLDTPLLRVHPSLLTAQQLRRGEVAINTRARLYDASGSVEDSGITLFYDLGLSWGILDTLALTLQFQHIDSNFPHRQGPFRATATADNEGTLALQYRLWHNAAQTLQLGAIGSLSIGDRGERFRAEGRVVETSNHDLVPALQLPFTATFAGRWHLTLAPTGVFFPDSHALYLFRPPVANAEGFGPLFGFSGAVSYHLHGQFVLWGDGFVPVLGNNSVDRGSGQPDTAFAFHAGVRYLLNPRLAIDVFATNTLGSTGPLAFLGDPDNVGFGSNVVFLPDLAPANRRYPNRLGTTEDVKTFLATVDGIAFFDGGILPTGHFRWDVQGGTQGVLSALHFTPVEDLALAVYLDYIWGEVDESEQGVGLKVRVLNQAAQQPFTASLGITVGLPNRVFLNVLRNDNAAFDTSGLEKNVPFLPRGDTGREGEVFLMTFSLPMQYQLESGAALWLTPILGVVQRRGVEIAGVNIGGALPLFCNRLSVLAEVGGNLAGKGNAFLGDRLDDAVPWAAAARLHLDRLQHRSCFRNQPGPYLEAYVTNRVGASPFHSLRVRDDNEVAFGASVSLPFKF